jgi:drug/metabolite transporter (DMT)-like permease
MIGASLAFTGMAACIKLASGHGTPLGQIVFYRGLVSLIVMYCYLRWLRIPLATPHWKAHTLRSVAGFAGMGTYTGAISMLPLATAITLNYTSPLLLGFMLLVVHRERPHPLLVATLLSGLAGVVILLRPTFDSSQSLGAAFALVSAVLAAFSALNMRALGRLAEAPERTVLYFSLFITVASLPWFVASTPGSLDGEGALYVLGCGLLATLGQFMITLAYQQGQTLLVSLLGYSQVVFASLLAIVLWDDRLPLASWLGMALIVASGAAATFVARPRTAASD